MNSKLDFSAFEEALVEMEVPEPVNLSTVVVASGLPKERVTRKRSNHFKIPSVEGKEEFVTVADNVRVTKCLNDYVTLVMKPCLKKQLFFKMLPLDITDKKNKDEPVICMRELLKTAGADTIQRVMTGISSFEFSLRKLSAFVFLKNDDRNILVNKSDIHYGKVVTNEANANENVHNVNIASTIAAHVAKGRTFFDVFRRGRTYIVLGKEVSIAQIMFFYIIQREGILDFFFNVNGRAISSAKGTKRKH